MKPLQLANSSNIQVGDEVVAIGNPLGLTGSMTEGIVSQTGRIKPDANTGEFWVPGLIQTDTPITYGNSGGPLLNMYGQVIGVTERGEAESETEVQGFNFAIPSNTVQRVVPGLIVHHTYQQPWLGIHVVDITSDIAKDLRLNNTKGVIVVSVELCSPAERAGISAGKNATTIDFQRFNSDADVILEIDHKIVRDISDLINYIDTKNPTDTVGLKLFSNDGIIHDVSVKLAPRPTVHSECTAQTVFNQNVSNISPYRNQSSQLERPTLHVSGGN